MLRQHPGDVVINHHYLISQAVKLLGKNTNCCRATADAHALFFNAVNHGRFACLNDQLRAAINRELDRLLVTQRLHHFHRDAAFFFAAARQVMHATQRQHLRAVLGGGDVAHDLAFAAHIGLFGP